MKEEEEEDLIIVEFDKARLALIVHHYYRSYHDWRLSRRLCLMRWDEMIVNALSLIVLLRAFSAIWNGGGDWWWRVRLSRLNLDWVESEPHSDLILLLNPKLLNPRIYIILKKLKEKWIWMKKKIMYNLIYVIF